MTDKIDSGKEKDTDLATEAGQSRRKFAKTGLAGGATLMALSSRSAFGTGGGWNQNCSVDVLYSIYNGGSEYDFDPTACRFGCTPGFWQGGAAGKAWAEVGTLSSQAGLPAAPWRETTQFRNVFVCADGVIDAILAELQQPVTATLYDIVRMPNRGNTAVKQAARNSVAGMLNCCIMGIFYAPGATPQDIINEFCAAAETWYNSGKTDTGHLSNIHTALNQLNEFQSDCPLDNSDNNVFYGHNRESIGLY